MRHFISYNADMEWIIFPPYPFFYYFKGGKEENEESISTHSGSGPLLRLYRLRQPSRQQNPIHPIQKIPQPKHLLMHG